MQPRGTDGAAGAIELLSQLSHGVSLTAAGDYAGGTAAQVAATGGCATFFGSVDGIAPHF